ncbi:MAG TPA: hypothetical protein VFJ90_09205 [Candidatus Didemnitutus sp.]|nr:hypothetical protein [Candidatus Didemnitutus sp.]
MKSLHSLFLMVLAMAGLTANAASSRWETLRAINWVENPTNQTRYGSKGELGPYQFRRDTWRLHTSKPFTMAIDRATADEVAVAHYEWIKDGLKDAGIEPTTFNIAMAWNCGLGAVKNGRVPTVSYHYAEQVTNLAEEFGRRAREEQLAQYKPQQEQPVNESPVAVAPRFSIEADALRLVVPGQQQQLFTIADSRQAVQPVGQLVKITVVDPEPAPMISLSIEKPLFTFTTASAPRIALID